MKPGTLWAFSWYFSLWFERSHVIQMALNSLVVGGEFQILVLLSPELEC